MFTRPSQDRIGPRIHGERTRAYKQSSIGCTNCFTADKYTSGHSLGIDIAVELISKTLIDEKFVSVIDCTEPGAASLARAWPAIRYTVFQTLETFASTKGYTTAISLLRLGYDRAPSYNPRTVYITLDYSSSGYAWPPVLRQLQKYVDTFNMGLVVHMEHNLVDGMSELPVPQSDLSSLERDLVQEKHGLEALTPTAKKSSWETPSEPQPISRASTRNCATLKSVRWAAGLRSSSEARTAGSKWASAAITSFAAASQGSQSVPQWSKGTGPMLSVIAQIIPYQTLLAGRRIWRDFPPRTEEHLRTWSTHRA